MAPDESGFYFGFGNYVGDPLDDLWFYDFVENTYDEVNLPDAPSARGFSVALPGGRGAIGTLYYGYDMGGPVDSIWRLLASSDEPMWW
ncbi:MAG: hypothetical protein GY822_08430 [Deltaproteobacteria bacterium]|nr:hypothetical protein [Deltaproteobacteria bacterium]